VEEIKNNVLKIACVCREMKKICELKFAYFFTSFPFSQSFRILFQLRKGKEKEFKTQS